MPPSTIPVHRLAGGEVDEVESCARWAGEGLKTSSFLDLLLLEMCLHIHARLRASEYDQIGHRSSI
jgi:hypothetical protein